MNNNIVPFEFHGTTVRTMTGENGEPLFVASDVAKVLGYANPRDAIARHTKGVAKHDTLSTAGGTQQVRVITEPDVYRLITHSKLPQAEEFERWVFEEVLPSLRRHGAYMTPATLEKVMQDPDFTIGLLNALKSEQEARRALEAQAAADRPKVVFADAVATSKTSILVGELAKILRGNGVSMGQNRLFEWMRTNGFLVRRKGTDRNMPTQRSMELGLFEIKETAITHSDGHVTVSKTPKVTGKGQQYFLKLFLADGLDLTGDAA